MYDSIFNSIDTVKTLKKSLQISLDRSHLIKCMEGERRKFFHISISLGFFLLLKIVHCDYCNRKHHDYCRYIAVCLL